MKTNSGQGGFTLIELMVSTAILAVAIGAMAASFIAQDSTFRVNEQIIDLQSNIKTIAEGVTTDLSSAGGGLYGLFDYTGTLADCTKLAGMPTVTNDVTSTNKLCNPAKYNRGVLSMVISSNGYNSQNAVHIVGVDPIRMFPLTADTASAVSTSSSSSFTFVYTCGNGSYVFKSGDYAIVSNYNHANVFKVTASTVTGGSCSKSGTLCSCSPTTATGTVTITATDVLGRDSVDVGVDENSSSTHYYVSYKYEAGKASIGLLKSTTYFGIGAAGILQRSTGLLNTDSPELLAVLTKGSFEVGYSTRVGSLIPHKVDTYRINKDQCSSTTAWDEDNVPVAVKVNMLASTDRQVVGNTKAKMPESSAYSSGVQYVMETTGADGTATTLSTTASWDLYYRMNSFQVDLKNMYGVDYGDNNEYLASLRCK